MQRSTMKTAVVKHTPQEIADLIDSDDELPDTYIETPDIPAYLNNNRFAKITWDQDINKKRNEEDLQREKMQQKYKEISSKTFASQNVLIQQNTLSEKMMLISKGTLCKRDIFLVKSIQEYSTANTLLWFIDFLSHKTVTPTQRSCLVADIVPDSDFNATKEPFLHFNSRYYFKTVLNS